MYFGIGLTTDSANLLWASSASLRLHVWVFRWSSLVLASAIVAIPSPIALASCNHCCHFFESSFDFVSQCHSADCGFYSVNLCFESVERWLGLFWLASSAAFLSFVLASVLAASFGLFLFFVVCSIFSSSVLTLLSRSSTLFHRCCWTFFGNVLGDPI